MFQYHQLFSGCRSKSMMGHRDARPHGERNVAAVVPGCPCFVLGEAGHRRQHSLADHKRQEKGFQRRLRGVEEVEGQAAGSVDVSNTVPAKRSLFQQSRGSQSGRAAAVSALAW